MAKATARVKPASPVRPGPPAKPAAPAADRWGTFNNFVDHGLQELAKETRSPSAGLVWFVLFRLRTHRRGSCGGRVSGAWPNSPTWIG